jgi:hypothetical protein
MKHSAVFLLAWTFAIMAGAAEKSGRQGAGAKSAPEVDLNGVWRGFVVEGKGDQPDQGPVHLELTIKGNRITAQRLDGGGSPLGQGTYRITTGRVNTIDAMESRGRGKPRLYLGICQIDPDLIRWCVATPGNKRPADFQTRGQQQFLLILKRQKE